jgi:hypothetical protein
MSAFMDWEEKVYRLSNSLRSPMDASSDKGTLINEQHNDNYRDMKKKRNADYLFYYVGGKLLSIFTLSIALILVYVAYSTNPNFLRDNPFKISPFIFSIIFAIIFWIFSNKFKKQ